MSRISYISAALIKRNFSYSIINFTSEKSTVKARSAIQMFLYRFYYYFKVTADVKKKKEHCVFKYEKIESLWIILLGLAYSNAICLTDVSGKSFSSGLTEDMDGNFRGVSVTAHELLHK